MKKYLGLGFLVLLSVTSVAKADFHGEWQGTGDVSGGINLHCRKIYLSVTQSSSQLEEEQGNAACGIFNQTIDPETFEIRGSELWQDDQKVGDISDSVVHAHLVQPNATYTFTFKLVSDGSLTLDADVVKPNLSYHLSGSLERQN
jgi:hypothetical protein